VDYEKALQEINKKIGKGCVFKTQTELADSLGIAKQNISAILAGKRAIPQPMLDIANLERVKHPDTYRRKEK
jgi:plasmid maintenance system antidote protein VapI